MLNSKSENTTGPENISVDLCKAPQRIRISYVKKKDAKKLSMFGESKVNTLWKSDRAMEISPFLHMFALFSYGNQCKDLFT